MTPPKPLGMVPCLLDNDSVPMLLLFLISFWTSILASLPPNLRKERGKKLCAIRKIEINPFALAYRWPEEGTWHEYGKGWEGAVRVLGLYIRRMLCKSIFAYFSLFVLTATK